MRPNEGVVNTEDRTAASSSSSSSSFFSAHPHQQRMDPCQVLPLELSVYIFSFLPSTRVLREVSLVSKTWQAVAWEPSLWLGEMGVLPPELAPQVRFFQEAKPFRHALARREPDEEEERRRRGRGAEAEGEEEETLKRNGEKKPVLAVGEWKGNLISGSRDRLVFWSPKGKEEEEGKQRRGSKRQTQQQQEDEDEGGDKPLEAEARETRKEEQHQDDPLHPLDRLPGSRWKRRRSCSTMVVEGAGEGSDCVLSCGELCFVCHGNRNGLGGWVDVWEETFGDEEEEEDRRRREEAERRSRRGGTRQRASSFARRRIMAPTGSGVVCAAEGEKTIHGETTLAYFGCTDGSVFVLAPDATGLEQPSASSPSSAAHNDHKDEDHPFSEGDDETEEEEEAAEEHDDDFEEEATDKGIESNRQWYPRAAGWECCCVWRPHKRSVQALAVWKGLLYVGSLDNTISVWQLHPDDSSCTSVKLFKPEKVRVIQAHERGGVRSLVEWNNAMLSGGGDGVIRMWNDQGHCIATFAKEESHFIRSMVVWQGLLLSGGFGGEICVWDERGTCLRRIQPSASPSDFACCWVRKKSEGVGKEEEEKVGETNKPSMKHNGGGAGRRKGRGSLNDMVVKEGKLHVAYSDGSVCVFRSVLP
ncbi:hypothetical protein QOT17_014369 [Balamuthia mandrillaris]